MPYDDSPEPPEPTTTVVVQIGNSDDRLTQSDWNRFYVSVNQFLTVRSHAVHFSGASVGHAPWQNACFVAEIYPGLLDMLRKDLSMLAKDFGQHSIALTVGTTEFVQAPPKETVSEFEVWLEGYATNGERGPARLLGSYQAETFQEACLLADKDKNADKQYGEFDPERLTMWGCKMYPTYDQARRAFG